MYSRDVGRFGTNTCTVKPLINSLQQSMREVLKPVTYDTVGGAHSSQSKTAGNVLDKGIKEIKKGTNCSIMHGTRLCRCTTGPIEDVKG